MAEYDFEQALYWKNIPLQQDKLGFIGCHMSHLGDDIGGEVKFSFLKNITTPYFIFTGVGNIPDVDFTIPDEIDFYLYEPLTYYRKGDDYNLQFYSEYENNNNLCVTELDCLTEWVKKYNCNINVKTCDYNVVKYWADKYPLLNLECFDIFVRNNSPQPYFGGNTWNGDIRKKKFICPNWRYTPHRHLMLCYLANKEATYSWNYNVDYSLDKMWWVDYDKLSPIHKEMVIEGEKKLNQQKGIIDYDYPVRQRTEKNMISFPSGVYEHNEKYSDIYSEHAVGIINETKFASPTANFSEKTMDAMIHGTGFVLAAPPYTLEYINSLGFETFSSYWDESYDMEEDPMKRMDKIMSVLDYISQIKSEELHATMSHIIEANYSALSSLQYR